MTTSGTKNQRFLCQMKMESEVACAHSVTLTATAGLIIDKAGVVGAELGYNYPAGQGLIAQDVGILPTSCGSGKLFAAITSPYFVTPSGLKIKRDVIDIQVECEEPDGWHGVKYGIIWSSNAPATWTDNNLYYKYTHPVGANKLISFAAGGLSMAIIASGAGSAVSGPGVNTGYLATAPGVYIFKVYTYSLYSSSAAPTPLGSVTFDVTIGGVVGPSTTVGKRGIKWQQYATTSADAGDTLNAQFGAVAHKYEPGIAFPFYGYNGTPTGFGGSISIVGDVAYATGPVTTNGGTISISRRATDPAGGIIPISQELQWV